MDVSNVNIIDLSSPLEKNQGEVAPFIIKETSHREGGDKFGKGFAYSKKHTIFETLISRSKYLLGFDKISSKSFPNNEFINMETVTLSTHTGTHMDAPYHYGTISENAPACTIDKIPLEWCYSDGILLDLRHKTQGEIISEKDIINSLECIKYSIKPFDIVLIQTGMDHYWGTPQYFTNGPGMSREAVAWLIDKGVKIIGIDSYSLDRPFHYMINDYFTNNCNQIELFPAHLYGREQPYFHIERLCDFSKIPCSYGFKIICLPIKLKGAGASWCRVVALV